MSVNIFDVPVGPTTIAFTCVIYLNKTTVEVSGDFEHSEPYSYKKTTHRTADLTINKTLTRVALPSAGYAAYNWTIPDGNFSTFRVFPTRINPPPLPANQEYPEEGDIGAGQPASLPYFRNVLTHMTCGNLILSSGQYFPPQNLTLGHIDVTVIPSPAPYYTVEIVNESYDSAGDYSTSTTTTTYPINNIKFYNYIQPSRGSLTPPFITMQWQGQCFLNGLHVGTIAAVPFKVENFRRQSNNSLDTGGTATVTVPNNPDTAPGIVPSFTYTGTETYTFTVTTS